MVKKIKKPVIEQKGRISLPDIINQINYHELHPAFSFAYVQKDYCLSKWETNKIRSLIEKLCAFERLNWSQIELQKFCQFGKVNKTSLKPSIPKEITPDTSIYYFKPFGQNTSHRVFGVKERHNFKFIWFDKNHEVYNG